MTEAWTWRPLTEVTIRGSTWNPRTDPRPAIRYVDVSAISRDELRIISDAEYSAANAPSRARKIVKAGDTIFATIRPALRRIAQIPASLDDEIVSTAFCVLRPNPSAIHPDFLYFAMQLECVTDGISLVQTGASYPAVRDADVLNQAVPLPPLSDQYAIATALKLARSAVLCQKRCEDAAMSLKRTVMQALFTRGLRGEVQKDTEIGLMPESWKQMPISALGEIVTGNTPPTKDPANYASGEIPFVGPGDLEHGFRIEKTEKLITRQGLENSRPVTAGATCFVCIGSTIGKVGYATSEICATNQQINSILPTNRFDPLFTFYLMVHWAEHARKQAAPSPVPILSKGVFSQVQILATTDLDEQREIVTILEAVDRKIDLHRRKRAVLEELFKALLHKLMTGEIRTGELNLAGMLGARA